MTQNSLIDLLWCEKYRPKTLDSYIFQDDNQKTQMEEMIAKQAIPHILMSGPPGSGKTTAAFILINSIIEYDQDVLIIDGSRENSVDMVRNKMSDFASAAPMGHIKIILIEEADRLSPEAQDAMKRLMEEESDDVRLILNCNSVHRILPPIKSRCTVKYQFNLLDKVDVTEYLANILVQEKIKFKLDMLDAFIELGYPDVRTILGLLEQHSVNGVLQSPTSASKTDSDTNLTLLKFIEKDEWLAARKLICETVPKENYESIYRYLYENLSTSKKFQNQDKWEEAIILIAQYLYRVPFVSDPEINLAALFIELGAIK